MAFNSGLLILVFASLFAVSFANTTVVGGNENWHFGFNYTNWAFQNSPFYLNDTLVFKFDPPNGTNFPHSVYMFRDFWSFLKCDLRRAKMVANVTQGGGQGFKFVMKKWQPYYFACGERAGFQFSLQGWTDEVCSVPSASLPDLVDKIGLLLDSYLLLNH